MPSLTFLRNSHVVALLGISSGSMFLHQTEIQILLNIEIAKSSSFLEDMSAISSLSSYMHSMPMLFLL